VGKVILYCVAIATGGQAWAQIPTVTGVFSGHWVFQTVNPGSIGYVLGSHFGTSKNTSIAMGALNAKVLSVSKNQIRALFPPSLPMGVAALNVTVGGRVSGTVNVIVSLMSPAQIGLGRGSLAAALSVAPAPPSMVEALPSPNAPTPSSETGTGGIVYTCDTTINAVSATASKTLNTTIAALYSSAFTNADATIYITLGSTGLGMSNWVSNYESYDSFRNALIASEAGVNDSVAVADSVPTVNPFGSDAVGLVNPLHRALGFTSPSGLDSEGQICSQPGTAGCYDGIITVSNAQPLYFRSGDISSNQYDFFTVVEHETDEILGTASRCCGSSSGTVFPADYFRYHSDGTRSFAYGANDPCSSNDSTNACFSIDGVNMLQQYNNLNNAEDTGDWVYNCAHPLVQDYATCSGTAGVNISPTAEILVLDVVGYTLVSKPPSVTTGVAGSVTSNNATLYGTVNPNGVDTHYWFLYGTGSSLAAASQSPIIDIGSGTTAASISGNAPGLSGSTTYYYQIQASSSAGTSSGSIASFTTPTGCTYSLTATSASFGAAASTGTVGVTAANGCGWMASSNAAWLTITPGTSGSGNGTVGYSVAANASSSQRAATLTIAGQTFTVMQDGAPATPVSVTPATGSSQSQTFAAMFTDVSGVGVIATAYILFGSDTSGVNSCWIQFNTGSNSYSIMNDTGTTWSAPVSVGSGTVSNSQCTFSGAGAGATSSGNNLTVNFPITFAASYAGAQNVYLNVVDGNGLSSGWQQLGSFAVTGDDAPSQGPIPVCNAQGFPCVVSLTPITGNGISGTFTGVFNHAGGASQHYVGYILFLPTPNIVDYTATGSCLVEYNRIDNAMRLVNNAGTNWLPGVLGIPLTQGGTLTNNFCTLNITNSSAVISGTTMTVTVAMTFNSSFSGELATFMQAFDVTGAFTGMTQFGNWEVDAGARKPGPYVVGMTPTSGSGSSATLSFTTGDTQGVRDLDFVTMLIAPVIDGSLPCQAFYFPYSNTINLVNDSSTAMVSTTGIVPGTVGTLSNSRCSINTGGASSSSTIDNVTITLPMTFDTTTFGGAKNIYLNAFDNFGNLSHWVTSGTWTVR